MSIGIEPIMRDPDVPGSKLPGGGGAGNPIPGGSNPPTFGFGGGNSPGTFGSALTGGDSGALRALLRKRLALPTATPSYLTSDTGAATMDSTTGVGQMSANSGMFGGNLIRLLQKQGKLPNQPAGGNTGADWTPTGANPSGDPTIGLTDWSGTGWDRSRTLNNLYELLQKYSDFGSFSPEGNKGLMDSVRTGALADAEAIRQRNNLIGSNLGVDPSTAGSFALQSDLNSQGGVADALSAASRGVLERQDEFGKQLLGMLGNLNAQDWMAERQGDISKRYAPDQPSGWQSFLGNLAGSAVGSYFGNPRARGRG